MKKTRLLLVVMLSVLFATATMAQKTITGVWKTIDDKTGKPKSYVELYMKDGKMYGKITKLLEPGKNETTTCTACPTEGKYKSRGAKLVGLDIIKGLEKDGNMYSGDEGIMDPNTGDIYDCEVWLDPANPDKLNVRGYLYFFFRTQVWQRL